MRARVVALLLVAAAPLVLALSHCGDATFAVAVTPDGAVEAASDAGASSETGTSDAPPGTRFCGLSKHTFCADFDDGTGFVTLAPSTLDATITLDPLAVSLPSSALFTLASTGTPTATLNAGLSTPGPRVACRFDLRVSAVEELRVFTLEARDPMLKAYELQFGIGRARTYLIERGGLATGTPINEFHTLSQTIALDGWHSVTIDLAFTQGKGPTS
jgi:hypothetical protein